MSQYELVIRGGTVADGSGAALAEADIGIRDGRIAAIGAGLAAGAEELDARDRLVTPGFVDLHTHYDGQVTWDRHFAPSTEHGVTTVLMGNCGVGFAPCRPGERGRMMEIMEGVEEIPGSVMAAGLPWTWESFPEFLDALAGRRMDADFAVAVPHIPVRVYVMGQRAVDREPARGDDLRQMAALVREGMQAGAFGFSTTRVIGHRTARGEQLPVTTAGEDELLAIALAMREVGRGLFMSASEFDTSNGFSAEFRLLQRIAAHSGQTVTFPLLQYNEAPRRWREIADACAAARAVGADMYGQVVARPVGVLLGLELSRHPFKGCPSYDAIAGLPLAERVAAMRAPTTRAAILAEVQQPAPNLLAAFTRQYHLYYPMGARPDYTPAAADRLDAVAARRGLAPAEAAYEALLADDGHGILYFPARNYSDGNLDTVLEMLRREDTVLGLGDGGAHVGSICDASMQTFMLAYWTRDRPGERLGIPEAVHAMTGRTAFIAGFRDRGLLRPGYKADLNVIDYDRLQLRAPRPTYDLPAGGRRLSQAADGYAATLVSGVVTRRDGEPTGALPGRLVRREPGTGIAGRDQAAARTHSLTRDEVIR